MNEWSDALEGKNEGKDEGKDDGNAGDQLELQCTAYSSAGWKRA